MNVTVVTTGQAGPNLDLSQNIDHKMFHVLTLINIARDVVHR
jgi:hypothetical protein